MPSHHQSHGALAAPSSTSSRKRRILAILAMAGLAQAAVAAPLQRRQAVPVVFQATLGNCWGNPATFGFGGSISHNGHAPQNEDVGLAALQITFSGATTITVAQTWNVANSRTAGNVWSFETQNDQPNIGGNFQATGVTCNGGQLSTPITVTMSGKMLSGAAIAPSIVGNAAGGGGAAAGNGGGGGNAGTPAPVPATPAPTPATPAPAPIPDGCPGAPGGQDAQTPPVPVPDPATPVVDPPPQDAPATPAPVPAPAPAAGGGGGGAVPVVFQAQLGNCWGTSPAMFGFGGTLSHNGHAPQNEDVGLAALQITFAGATAITAAQTWNVANSATQGNVWSFESMNDQPNVGGNFAATGVTCNGGQLDTPITVTMAGQMLSGAAIAPSIVGNAAGGGGGGGNGGNAGGGGGAGTPAPAPVPATPAPATPAPAAGGAMPAPVPAAPAPAGAVPYSFTYDFSSCYPAGGSVNFQTNIRVAVNGNDQPADDRNGGLAAIKVTFGGLASVGIANSWGITKSVAQGNVWSFETVNDAPNIGGIFVAPEGVTCTGQKPSVVPTLSVSGALLSGAPIAVTVVPKA